MPVRNVRGTANFTAMMRAINTHREAFLNQQQFMSQEMAKAALAAYAAAEAAKPKELFVRTNNCKQQGGTRKRVSKIKRKVRRNHSRNVKGHRSR